MATALFLVDNLFNTLLYPNHTVVANEEATGFEASKVANGRRRPDDHWESTTANAVATIEAQCDIPRAANFIMLDRGHNLGGTLITLQVSADGSTWTEEFSATVASNRGPGSVDDRDGFGTREGAWGRAFPFDAALNWRLQIAAMGAGVVPNVVGLWVGLAFTVDYLDLPQSRGRRVEQVPPVVSFAGWAGSQPSGNGRQGSVAFKLPNYVSEDWARIHFEDNYGTPGRPMWIIHNTDAAHDAVLTQRVGELGFGQDRGWSYPTIAFNWKEHQPEYVL